MREDTNESCPTQTKKKLKQKENWLKATKKTSPKQKNLCDKKSAQTNLVVHKKFTTKLSTTFSSKKLHCVGDELSIKKCV